MRAQADGFGLFGAGMERRERAIRLWSMDKMGKRQGTEGEVRREKVKVLYGDGGCMQDEGGGRGGLRTGCQ